MFLPQEEYVFCYELVDQIIARKSISLQSDSDIDEPSSPGTLGDKNLDPDVMKNHTPEINGTVVMDTSSLNAGKDSPKVGSLKAGNASPKSGNSGPSADIVNSKPKVVKRNTSGGIDNPFAANDSLTRGSGNSDVDTGNASTGISSPSAGNDALSAESPKRDSPIAAPGSPSNDNPDDESPEISDNEHVNKTTSSRQALLTSSDSSS